MARLAHAVALTGCLLVVGFLLWSLLQVASRDLAAFAGVLILWVTGCLSAIAFIYINLKTPYAPQRN
jgi:hypothetical protein